MAITSTVIMIECRKTGSDRTSWKFDRPAKPWEVGDSASDQFWNDNHKE